MTVDQLETQFLQAMDALQESFIRQHQQWQLNYSHLIQQYLQLQQREEALCKQNESLLRRLNMTQTKEQEAYLVTVLRDVAGELDALAEHVHNNDHPVSHK